MRRPRRRPQRPARPQSQASPANRSSTFARGQTRKSRAESAELPGSFGRRSLDSGPMRRLLVANRGEIALRIFRACARPGVETVAVVAPDDRGSLHARSADATVEITSYLDPAEHVRAAREAGADAVHPGYGFLSESAELRRGRARRGADLGRAAAGGAARRAATSSRRSETARAAGVPVLPSGTPEELGFPLLVKAAAGGGGRGMRVVRAAEELDEAVAAARREAEAAFGDDSVFCERYLERPRHVEIQLLADAHGTVARARRARLLDPAPPPEGARGVALAGARPGAASRDERRRGRASRARSATRARAPPSSCSTAATSSSSS